MKCLLGGCLVVRIPQAEIRPRVYKTRVQSQTQNKAQLLAACGHEPIISLYFESENELKFYNLEAGHLASCVAFYVMAFGGNHSKA